MARLHDGYAMDVSTPTIGATRLFYPRWWLDAIQYDAIPPGGSALGAAGGAAALHTMLAAQPTGERSSSDGTPGLLSALLLGLAGGVALGWGMGVRFGGGWRSAGRGAAGAALWDREGFEPSSYVQMGGPRR
eukprot:2309954-Prymnesium_polylepis.1